MEVLKLNVTGAWVCVVLFLPTQVDLPITRTMRQIPHAKQPYMKSAVKSFAAVKSFQTAPEQVPNKLKDDLDKVALLFGIDPNHWEIASE
jgi:hypothetical protein